MPPAMSWADENGWNYAKQFGVAGPDLVVSSPKYTQKAVAMDAWYKPVVETGLTEPRWVRAIEMRPCTLKGRKITHHALAYLMQDEKEAAALLSSPDADSGAGLFMEWAVNKQGEMMRANTGKLMLPGAKIRWDIHYSAAGEDVTDDVQLGIYFYPKGETPKYRTALSLYSGIQGGNRALDIAPNTISVTQNFHVMRRAGRVENFQPHMHLRGKAMMLEAILPNGQQQVLGHVNRFEFNWMNNYVFDDDYAPLLPRAPILRVTSWHDNTAANKNNPDPNAVGRLGRSHRRRDGARLDQHHLHERRRLHQGSRSAQGRRWRPPPSASSSSSTLAIDFHLRGRRNRRPFCLSAEELLMSSIALRRVAAAAAGRRAVWPAPARTAQQELVMEPLKDAGLNVYPAFEGWYQNPDGSYRLLIGYYNRNKKQILDIPIGPAEPDRTGRSRPGPADALPRRPRLGHHRRSRCRTISATRS